VEYIIQCAKNDNFVYVSLVLYYIYDRINEERIEFDLILIIQTRIEWIPSSILSTDDYTLDLDGYLRIKEKKYIIYKCI
jgi:hypothetical protein